MVAHVAIFSLNCVNHINNSDVLKEVFRTRTIEVIVSEWHLIKVYL